MKIVYRETRSLLFLTIKINTVKDMKEQILDIADKLRNGEINSDEAQNLLLCLFDVSGSLPLTFEQCLREEFLINTQNYPKEYHNLFNQKFNRARRRFEEQ